MKIGNAAFSKSANNNKLIFKLHCNNVFKKGRTYYVIKREHFFEDLFEKHRAVQSFRSIFILVIHVSALVGSDPHELAPEFEVWKMKGTHIGISELTLFKCYEIGLFRIRPMCFWSIR